MTECSACGECCDPVWYPLGPAQVRQGALTHAAHPAGTDLAFATAHWTATGERDGDGRHAYRCDRFDPATRLCTAHDERPPVCRGYPFYGHEPALVAVRLPGRCAFRADWPGEPAGVEHLF